VTARDPRFAATLRGAVTGEVREQEPLARYSTYRIGGPATIAFPATPDEVATLIRGAERAGVPWFALGLGSNVLLPDAGVDALVIRLGKGLDAAVEESGGRWRLGAGLPAPLAARRTAGSGYGGIHRMVGVPGTVGGGVYMNAGCHGESWADVVLTVTAVGAGGESRVIPRREIPFTYRHSGLEEWIVLETTVQLVPEAAERLTGEVNDLFRWRQQGTPFNQPCCGSVFRNPAPEPGAGEGHARTAGQLIEAAGLKGFTVGGAEVSPKHANYIVNTGNASAADVLAVIGHVRHSVRERFGVRLGLEVKVIGSDGRIVPDQS
jgi:UDP-N-acetylmuramate dehydrogenase